MAQRWRRSVKLKELEGFLFIFFLSWWHSAGRLVGSSLLPTHFAARLEARSLLQEPRLGDDGLRQRWEGVIGFGCFPAGEAGVLARRGRFTPRRRVWDNSPSEPRRWRACAPRSLGGTRGVGWGAGTSGGGTEELAEGFVGWGRSELGRVLDLQRSACPPSRCLICWLAGGGLPALLPARGHPCNTRRLSPPSSSLLSSSWASPTMGASAEALPELPPLLPRAQVRGEGTGGVLPGALVARSALGRRCSG